MNPLRILTICAMTLLLIGVSCSTPIYDNVDISRGELVQQTFHIGGTATDVVVQDSFAYVGYAAELAVVDIVDVTSPRRMGYVMVSANDLAMGDSHVYVAGTEGLRIVDVSAPADPKVIGGYATQQPALGIWVSGETAYVVTNRGGLHILDVQNPHHPTRLSFLAIHERMPDIAVAEPYAYIAANDGLHVVDVSNPYQPDLVAHLDLPGFAADVALSGNRLFLTNEFRGLCIIDVSDPVLPRLLQCVALNSMVWDVAVSSGIAYVASTEPGLHVVDGVLGTQPDPVFHLANPYSLEALSIRDDMLFGVNIDGDLHILNLTDNRHPVLVGTYDAPGYSVHVAASNTRAYGIADSGCSVYELGADLADPIVMTNLHIAPDFTVAIAATEDGFIASGEKTALWAGVIETDSSYRCDRFFPAQAALQEVAVSGSRIYGIGREPELLWVDDAEVKPLRHGTVILDDSPPRTVATAGDHVYVGGGRGLFVFSHSPEHIPEPVSFIETTGPVDIVRTDGAAAFAIVDSQQFCALDFTDRERPTIAGCLDLVSPAYGAVLYGDYAYVAVGDAGVSIIDMKDVAQPYLVDQIETAGRALDVAAGQGLVYIAAAAGGLYVLQL